MPPVLIFYIFSSIENSIISTTVKRTTVDSSLTVYILWYYIFSEMKCGDYRHWQLHYSVSYTRPRTHTSIFWSSWLMVAWERFIFKICLSPFRFPSALLHVQVTCVDLLSNLSGLSVIPQQSNLFADSCSLSLSNHFLSAHTHGTIFKKKTCLSSQKWRKKTLICCKSVFQLIIFHNVYFSFLFFLIIMWSFLRIRKYFLDVNWYYTGHGGKELQVLKCPRLKHHGSLI